MRPTKRGRVVLLCCAVLLLLLSTAAIALGDDGGFLRSLAARDPMIQSLLALFDRTNDNPDLATGLAEDKSIYNLAGADRVTVLLVEASEKDGATLASFDTPALGEGLRLPAVVREGTSQGTVRWFGFGYDALAPNATLEVRGVPRANRKYHNFKLRLEDGAGQLESQSVINLKKGYAKPTRIEEKFALDLFAALPNMMSLRSSFVHLYVMDSTAPNPGYMDYGLYTMVEQPDRYYFTNRGLDDSGNLYQAEDFDFRPHTALREVSDPGYDRGDFEDILDIKTGDTHTDLLAMLVAVNDTGRDIDGVIDEFFDRENLLTWLAMNILLANNDCVTSGYLLYRPSVAGRWYFLPHNMSDAMPAAGDIGVLQSLHTGLSMFSGNLLYERFLAVPANVDALRARANELLEFFDEAAVRELTDRYIAVLTAYLSRNPDRGTLRVRPEKVVTDVARYRQNMVENLAAFEATLDSPRRVELLSARQQPSGGVAFRWSPSVAMDGGPVTYLLEVSAAPDFSTVAASAETNAPEASLRGLPTGALYWRVTAIDSAGRTAGSLGAITLADDTVLYGRAAFRVIP